MKLLRQSFILIFCVNWFKNYVSASGVLHFSSDLPDQSAEQAIPKVFHTIWLNFGRGDKVFPKYLDNMEELKRLHPGWELKLWNEDQIIELIKQRVPSFLNTYLNYNPKIKKHDSARAVILYFFGGVYLDHDFIPLKNIEPLLKSYNFVVGNECTNAFVPVNGFMACSKGFGLMRDYMDRMNAPGVAQKTVLEATGPALLKETMLQYAKNNDISGIKVYYNEIFYPVIWYNKQLVKGKPIDALKEAHPNCYLLQEYDASWKA